MSQLFTISEEYHESKGIYTTQVAIIQTQKGSCMSKYPMGPNCGCSPRQYIRNYIKIETIIESIFF